MAANNILPFAQGGGANVLAQGSWVADAQRPLGNQPGVARADFVNKALLQALAMAVGAGQFLADKQATDVTDQLTGSALSTMWQSAIRSLMGSFNGAVTIAGATVLSAASHMGKIIRTGGSGYTITMMPSAGLTPGDSFLLQASGTTGLITLACQGADVFDNGPTAPSSLTIGLGEDLLVTYVAANLFSVSGTGNLKNAAGFSASFGVPGYQRLPSGLILQWGLTVTSAAGAVAVAFPLAFPGQCLALTMGLGQNTSVGATYDSLTASGFNLHGWTPSTGGRQGFNGVSWTAIGF